MAALLIPEIFLVTGAFTTTGPELSTTLIICVAVVELPHASIATHWRTTEYAPGQVLL